MTQFILVRHANPDYSECEKKGISKNDAPLSQLGVQQARRLSSDPIFNGAEVLLSSPFRRAKETAMHISIGRDLPIIEEYDLRRSNLNLEMLKTRKSAKAVLGKYLNYSKVIVVTHAEVVLLLTGKWLDQGKYMIVEYC